MLDRAYIIQKSKSTIVQENEKKISIYAVC